MTQPLAFLCRTLYRTRPYFLIVLVVISPIACAPDAKPTASAESQPSAVTEFAIVWRGNATDETLRQWQGFSNLKSLELFHDTLTPQGLQNLVAQFPRLEHLRLERTEVTDQGLDELCQLSELQRLNLPHGSFSDTGVGQLHRLKKLQLLRFGSPNVTDASMTTIAQLPRLRFLHLVHVPITDRGIAELATMTRLESFYLDGGHASQHSLTELLRALPDLHFHQDQLHLPSDPRAGHDAEPAGKK